MPIGEMVGTSQIYMSSCLLRFLIQSGPVLFPSHSITLNFMCLYECESVVKCLDTGVDNDFLGFFALAMCS